MSREELLLKVLNDSARLLASQEKMDQQSIDLLVEGVGEHLLNTGTELLHFENLYVQVSFSDAEVLSFLIDNGAGRVLDVERHTDPLKAALKKNRREGLKRLIRDVEQQPSMGNLLQRMVFSKN